MKTESPSGGDRFYMASEPDGTLWLVLHRWQCVSYAIRRNGSWTDVIDIPSDGWKFINHATVAVDKTGHPVVIWTGFDNTPGEAIATLRWTGSEWTTPEVLDRLAPSTSVSCLQSLRDQSGIVHATYDRPLIPREDYNLGGHGMFPNKCWHATFDGTRWSTPAPTTGRGRFGVKPLSLSPGPDGRLVLAVKVERPQQPGYIGQQTWDGTSWTKPELVKDEDTGGLIATPWGDRLIWWKTYGTWAVGASVLRGDHEINMPWSPWNDTAPVTNDPAGRVVVYLHEHGGAVRVWNGEEWSNTLKCGEATQIIATMDGRAWLGRWQSHGVRLQEVFVREVPSSLDASGSAPSP